MAVHVALLRGINVGRHRQLAMGELRDALAVAGYADVRTHLRSGNVVLRSGDSDAKVEEGVRRVIAERFGMDVRVMVRGASELAEIVAEPPLGEVADEPKNHLVAFLDRAPSEVVVREILAENHAPEQVAFRGREMYLWCAHGQHESRLLRAVDDRRLGVTSTVRNWRTVERLAQMAAES